MMTLPQRVKTAFLRLKKANKQYIEIKHIKDYFFVYQSTSRWDKIRKKPIKVPLYIGRITNAGAFIPANKRKPRNLMQQSEGILKSQPVIEIAQKTLEVAIKEERKYKHESEILTALSMNGRISMSVLGKIVDLSETSTAMQVKKLEKKYDIKYIADIDITKFGYLRFMISIKFIDQFPKIEELKDIFSNEPLIQLVLLTKGDFDILIYAFAVVSKDITALVFRLRTKLDYKTLWNTAPVSEDYGAIQVRDNFVDLIKDKLLTREYAILKELGKDGKIDFTEIDRLYEFDSGRAQYSYYKLKEKGIIKRITISMQNLPIRYLAIIFEDIVDFKSFRTNRSKIIKDIISDSSYQVNKYLLVDDTTNPSGIVKYMPVFKDGDLESNVEHIRSFDSGINIRTYIITSVLLGNFCYRSFDNLYSAQQDILNKSYNEKLFSKIDYEETGRIKKKREAYTNDIRGVKSKPDII